MKTLGIEKRSAVLYVRIKPSLLNFVKAKAKIYKVKPARVVEAMIEAVVNDTNSKPAKSKKRA